MIYANSSNKLALSLACMHMIFFLMFVAYIELWINDGQSRLLWTIWLLIDFPISLIVPLIFDLVPRETEFYRWIRYYAPHLVHGLLGAAWWYCIGLAVSFLLSRVGKSK